MSKRVNLTILAPIALAALAAPAVMAQQVAKADLVAIKSSEVEGEQTLVFEFAGGKPPVKTFQLANPARLVLDFAGAANRLQNGGIAYQGLGLQSLDLAGDDNRLRVVLSLQEQTTARDSWNGSQYVVTLSRRGAKATQAPRVETATTTTATASPNAASMARALAQVSSLDGRRPAPAQTQPAQPAQPAQAVQAIAPMAASLAPEASKLARDILRMDFRKGKTPGSGRLSVDLTSADTPIDIKAVPGGLVIDFLGTNIPANLIRKFEVAAEMTPVSSIEFKQMGDRTRLMIRAQGKWEQTAYQVENRFFFEIKPVFTETMSKDGAAGKTFKGEKLTLNFQNIEVRTILQVLSDFSGLNIITSDSVSGNLTLRLKEVPWDQALDLIMQAKNLDKRQSGNVIWIAPQDEIRVKEKKDADFRAEQALNQQLVTESFEINYAKAPDVAGLLRDKTQPILSPRGSVVLDARTNIIFVQDIAERLIAVRAMIKKIDTPVKQVMIEARIVEANDTFGKSLGARLGFNQTTPTSVGGKLRGVVGGGLGGAAGTSGQATAGSFSDTYVSNLPAQGNGGNLASLFSLVLFNNAATRFLNLELSALVSDGRGQILSNPRIVTADKKEAVIEQGTQIPYQQASSSGATAVAFKNATLSLKVTPQINPNGDVMMDLNVTKDSVGVNTSAGPSIDTKSVKTQILVEDGGTAVIGGIYTQDDSVSESRTPFLGDLPIIGNAFKTRTTSRERREMLIFITPRILADRAVSDDLDAATAREELIKPISMDPEFLNAKPGSSMLPRLPNDKKRLRQEDIE